MGFHSLSDLRGINCSVWVSGGWLMRNIHPLMLGGGEMGQIFLAELKTHLLLLGSEGDTFAQIFACCTKRGRRNTESRDISRIHIYKGVRKRRRAVTVAARDRCLSKCRYRFFTFIKTLLLRTTAVKSAPFPAALLNTSHGAFYQTRPPRWDLIKVRTCLSNRQ